MVRTWLAFGAAAAMLALSSAPTWAQDYTSERTSNMRTLNRVDPAQRFAFAAENCESSAGAEEQLLVRCDLAVSAAFNERSRTHRDAFSDAERSTLQHAAWLNAVEGLRGPGLAAGDRFNTLSLDDASEPRMSAYALLASYRNRTIPQTATLLARVAHAVGLPDVRSTDSLQATRRRIIDAVLAGEHSPERLWAAAVASSTLGLEWPNFPRDWDAIADEGLALAPSLATLLQQPDRHDQDALLQPMIQFAYGRAPFFANDHARAAAALRSALDGCVAHVWPDADLCVEMAMAEAEARVSAQFAAVNPALMRLRSATPLAAQSFGREMASQNCRAVIVGDVADDGSFINISIPYAYPASTCSAMATRYAANRKYLPADQDDNTHRRQNIVIRLVLRVVD